MGGQQNDRSRNSQRGDSMSERNERNRNSQRSESMQQQKKAQSKADPNAKPSWFRGEKKKMKTKKRLDLRPIRPSTPIERKPKRNMPPPAKGNSTTDFSCISLSHIDFGDFGSFSMTDTMIENANAELGGGNSFGHVPTGDSCSVSRLMGKGAQQPVFTNSEKHVMIEKISDWIEVIFGEEGKDVLSRDKTKGKDIMRIDVK